jgi:hypothetical protein
VNPAAASQVSHHPLLVIPTAAAFHHPSLLCHLDRSVPGFPTSRCWQGPRVRLSLKRAACRSAKPRVVTGNPGERSGEICGFSGPFLGVFFDRGVMGLRPTQVMRNGSCSATTVAGSTALPFVISTGGYPDFLLRAAGKDAVEENCDERRRQHNYCSNSSCTPVTLAGRFAPQERGARWLCRAIVRDQ